MDERRHVVGFGSEAYEGGWLIYYDGDLPASEEQMCRDEADPFVFCPLCGARILPTGEERSNG